MVETQGKASGGPEGFKSAREAQRREDAGNRATWNSLYMRQDTVAEAVAMHYGVTKVRSCASMQTVQTVNLPVCRPWLPKWFSANQCGSSNCNIVSVAFYCYPRFLKLSVCMSVNWVQVLSI